MKRLAGFFLAVSAICAAAEASGPPAPDAPHLPANPTFEPQPVWSPDGSKIAFHTTRDGNVEVYVMNADGTGQHNVTNSPSADFDADWSPDGGTIAFGSAR